MEHLLITSLPDVKQRFVLCDFTLLPNMVYTSARLVSQSCSSNEVQEYPQSLLRQHIRQLLERLLLYLTRNHTSSFNCLIDELIHPQVRVPVANTLGKIGNGMQVILSNFNHERWMVVATSITAQRLIVEECLKSVYQFGLDPYWIYSSLTPGGQHSVSSLASHWLHKPWFGLNLQVWYLEWKPAKIGLNLQHIRWTTWVQLSTSTGWLDGCRPKYEIDELQPASWQARRSYWSIEAVRFLSYNPFKSLKYPGLYLALDGKQQKVKPFHALVSFYSLPFNISITDATQVFGGRALTVTGMGKLIENVIFSFALQKC